MSHIMTLTQAFPSISASSSIGVAHKRKTNNKTDKGLKWFKGAPKKTPNHKYRLLKSAQQESTSQVIIPPIGARVVELEIEGMQERLGVTEPLPIVEKETSFSKLAFSPIKPSDATPKLINSPSIPGRKAKVKVEKGRKNGKVQADTIVEDSVTDSLELLPLPEPSVQVLEPCQEGEGFERPNAYIRYMEATPEELSEEIEYDLEEEDIQWLEIANSKRKKQGVTLVKRKDMEFMMDRLEKESYFQMQSTGMDHRPPIDDDAVCCICMDGECQNSNAILFCDMCNLAVHQDCYGVPYIPEGQWLCRKCLHSPSRAVECVLCPNKGGALKGTDDGRWAHVACAIWIPEVCFANTVFLEPIESIGNIPPARWRLTCFICKQKGIGACIQCYKSSCYTAFHVTCAQQANLVMKMETVRETQLNSVIIKKTAYCNNHAPPELLLERQLKEGRDPSSPRMKMKQTRKILAEKRVAVPPVLIPTIPRNRIASISSSVTFPGKALFMKRLMSYWKLKRQLRNGVPLLRRLQMASSAPNAKSVECTQPKNGAEQQEQIDYYKSWVRLRQDLERARLLCEMIRKREKLKREYIYTRVKVAELEVCPMQKFFLKIIDEIGSRDVKEIFHCPVDPEEVPDYHSMIKEPMDLSTMMEKVHRLEYESVESLEADFDLMIQNCLLYNDKETIYYKTALRIRALGSGIFKKAKKIYESVGYEPLTGLHTATPPTLALNSETRSTPTPCKCSNNTCNNNCKKNPPLALPSIPASFTTYRTGGGGVESDTDGETELERSRVKIMDEDDDSESESSSFTSSGSESEEVDVATRPFSDGSSNSPSSSNSSSDDEEVQVPNCKTRNFVRLTSNVKEKPKRTAKRNKNPPMACENGEESDDSSSSSSSSTSSQENESINTKGKKLG